MELHRVTDTAARQAIDSAKTFKEYLRVRHELDALGGSMFWKLVDTYEYLVQRSARKLHYLGPRSPETEKKYEEHHARKKRLQERANALQTMVETYQRMNKAVHAGSVPTAIINVLRKLDDLGVGEHSLVLGAPAVYAYLQPSGVSVDAIKTAVQHRRLAESAVEQFALLIEEPSTLSAWKTTFSRIKTALKDVEVEEVASSPRAKTHVLRLVFLPDGEKPKKKSSTKREAAWVQAIKDTPPYEQVVIGQSGKMAMCLRSASRVASFWAAISRRRCCDSLNACSACWWMLMSRMTAMSRRPRSVSSELRLMSQGNSVPSLRRHWRLMPVMRPSGCWI